MIKCQNDRMMTEKEIFIEITKIMAKAKNSSYGNKK